MIIGSLFIINIFFIKIIICFSKNWFSTDRITSIVWNLVTSDLMKMWRIKQRRSLLYASQKSPLRRKSKSRKFTQNIGMNRFELWREGGQIWLLHIYSKYDLFFQLLYFFMKNAQNLADNHSFACTCIKKFVSIFIFVLKSKIFRTQDFLTLYNHSISFPWTADIQSNEKTP